MNQTILEVVVGSTVHGISVEDGLEDLDLMAILLEPLHNFAGFDPTEVWVRRSKLQGVRSEAGDIDWVGYGLRKYLRLALKGNPTVLIALFVPEKRTRVSTARGTQLQLLAPKIVSKSIYRPFSGYMKQQYERLLGTRGQKRVTRPELVEKYGFDTKYAAHVVRLGLQGEELLQTGKLSLPMRNADRELCVKIRTGGFTFFQVIKLIEDVESRLDAAHRASELPPKPDVAAVQAWMLEVYLEYWNSQQGEQR